MVQSPRLRTPGQGRSGKAKTNAGPENRTPTAAQLTWLRRGVAQPGGKLPLFDESGQRVSAGVVAACRRAGWAEPWFQNPLKPTWEVCRLTEAGRAMLAEISVVAVDFRRRRAATPPGPAQSASAQSVVES